MKFITMNAKRILSILLVLTLQMQTVSSSIVVSSAKGSTLGDPVTTFAVTVAVLGGNGTAVAVPENVNVGENGVVNFTPDAGYHVFLVTDNDVDVTALVLSNVYTIVNVQAAHVVNVTYALNEYALNVNVETTMTGLVNGVETLTQTLTHGTVVTLTAEPAKGYVFSHWTVDGTDAGTVNPLVLTMDAPKTVVAIFVADPNVVLAQSLVTFFEENTVLGTLTGLGKTAQAQQGKLKAFDNKLKAVVHALEAGDTADAVGLLTSTAAKVDGELTPPDFVGGDQSAELLARIQALIATLPAIVVPQ